MNNILTVQFITATRQRDPKLLTDFDFVWVRDFVNLTNLLIRNETTKNLSCDERECVVFPDSVFDVPVRDTGSVGARTMDWDTYDLVRVHALVTCGVEWEIVSSEDRTEVLDGEKGLDIAQRCCVLA